ncbi:hypothetical protein E2C01_067098 [Portunus trituberculatus]|uniref:Uncharacterized protein n=1 Tax=Portunus trituberculatus TaxID=210409 RepID=A0A5B7HSQ5_PORTR|nr:hypothetical protein [Portunus trituberculatus]
MKLLAITLSFQVPARDIPIDSLRHWPPPGVTTTHPRLTTVLYTSGYHQPTPAGNKTLTDERFYLCATTLGSYGAGTKLYMYQDLHVD